MDTIEEINGSYFYHGHANVAPQELFNLIFIEQLADELGLEITATALIVSGQPWLPTRAKPVGAKKGTSVASVLSRRILKNARLPAGMLIPTIVGGNIRNANRIGAILGRSIPWIGHALAIVTVYKVASATRQRYNIIARPEDRIQWSSF